MELHRRVLRYARLLAWTVIAYGLVTIASTLAREMRVHEHHSLNELLLTLPVLVGLSYIYLGTLLLRLKYNAWLTAMILSGVALLLNLATALERYSDGVHLVSPDNGLRIALPLLVLAMLYAGRQAFRVRSDRVGFRQAIRVSVSLLLVALLYGTLGFLLLDTKDFHQEISVPTAIHQTIDQFGITTRTVVPHTRRARIFVDSLSAISVGALLYVVAAFFQPVRFRLRPEGHQREMAEELLRRYPSDIDDFFKLWPHDKHYFFDSAQESGLAYRVTSDVALVVGNPFGDPKRFLKLCQSFQEFCFVNDWRPAFVHVSETHEVLYEKLGFRLQKIGEEAVLDLQAFQEHRNDKYFRQIRNRFTKLDYHVEVAQPPHSAELLNQLASVSQSWLERPGRAERGFMLGNHTNEYMQQCTVAVLRDAEGRARGFMNLVATFEPGTANYDLLRCDADTPGNGNDFLLLGLIDHLYETGVTTLNLGLCPLVGLDEEAEATSVIDTALRFIYANGDRFYSFTGLQRFKAKYHPVWEDRFVAYTGSPAAFVRTMTALTRAMKIK